MKKKNLRDKDKYRKIFINEDLTPLRSRMLKYIKDSQKFGPVWTMEGKIYCGKKLPPGAPTDLRERPKVIETPDDMFQAGFDTIDFDRLGLGDLFLDDDD